jgi:hypothetical protein
MNGSAPAVAVLLDSPNAYAPGAQVTATATITDPDTTSETLTSTDTLGRADTITINRVDPELVVWSWKSSGVVIATGVNPLQFAAPAASDVLLCTVTDGQGNVTTSTVAVAVLTPVWKGTTTAVNGAAPSWSPTADAVRVYTPQGKGCYGWSSAPMIAALKQKPKMIILSMKGAPTHALLDPVINNVPAGIILVLIFHHEPDQGVAAGDPSPAQYKADWAAGAAIVNALPPAKRAVVRMAEDFTAFAQLHGKEAWTDFWTGLADYIALDIYMNAISTTSYPAASALFALLLAAMKSTGKPGMVPEYGGQRIASDTDGSACAAAVTSHVSYAAAHGIIAMIWWGGSPYSLDGRPAEQRAWAAAVAGK